MLKLQQMLRFLMILLVPILVSQRVFAEPNLPNESAKPSIHWSHDRCDDSFCNFEGRCYTSEDHEMQCECYRKWFVGETCSEEANNCKLMDNNNCDSEGTNYCEPLFGNVNCVCRSGRGDLHCSSKQPPNEFFTRLQLLFTRQIPVGENFDIFVVHSNNQIDVDYKIEILFGLHGNSVSFAKSNIKPEECDRIPDSHQEKIRSKNVICHKITHALHQRGLNNLEFRYITAKKSVGDIFFFGDVTIPPESCVPLIIPEGGSCWGSQNNLGTVYFTPLRTKYVRKLGFMVVPQCGEKSQVTGYSYYTIFDNLWEYRNLYQSSSSKLTAIGSGIDVMLDFTAEELPKKYTYLRLKVDEQLGEKKGSSFVDCVFLNVKEIRDSKNRKRDFNAHERDPFALRKLLTQNLTEYQSRPPRQMQANLAKCSYKPDRWGSLYELHLDCQGILTGYMELRLYNSFFSSFSSASLTAQGYGVLKSWGPAARQRPGVVSDFGNGAIVYTVVGTGFRMKVHEFENLQSAKFINTDFSRDSVRDYFSTIRKYVYGEFTETSTTVAFMKEQGDWSGIIGNFYIALHELNMIRKRIPEGDENEAVYEELMRYIWATFRPLGHRFDFENPKSTGKSPTMNTTDIFNIHTFEEMEQIVSFFYQYMLMTFQEPHPEEVYAATALMVFEEFARKMEGVFMTHEVYHVKERNLYFTTKLMRQVLDILTSITHAAFDLIGGEPSVTLRAGTIDGVESNKLSPSVEKKGSRILWDELTLSPEDLEMYYEFYESYLDEDVASPSDGEGEDMAIPPDHEDFVPHTGSLNEKKRLRYRLYTKRAINLILIFMQKVFFVCDLRTEVYSSTSSMRYAAYHTRYLSIGKFALGNFGMIKDDGKFGICMRTCMRFKAPENITAALRAKTKADQIAMTAYISPSIHTPNKLNSYNPYWWTKANIDVLPNTFTFELGTVTRQTGKFNVIPLEGVSVPTEITFENTFFRIARHFTMSGSVELMDKDEEDFDMFVKTYMVEDLRIDDPVIVYFFRTSPPYPNLLKVTTKIDGVPSYADFNVFYPVPQKISKMFVVYPNRIRGHDDRPKERSNLRSDSDQPDESQESNDTFTLHLGFFGNQNQMRSFVLDKVTYLFGVIQGRCVTWDDRVDIWQTDGCRIVFYSTKSIKCECNHIQRTYGVSLLHYKIERSEFVSLSDFRFVIKQCDIIFITSLVWVGWLILALIWAIIVDIWAKKPLTARYLVDNRKYETYKYLIVVYTGSCIRAATTSIIGFKIYGTYLKTKRHLLIAGKSTLNKHLFRKNQVSCFILTTSECLGDLICLEIWHNFSGAKKHWFVDKILVKDLLMNTEYEFHIRSWLSLTYGDGIVHRIVPLTPKPNRTLNYYFYHMHWYTRDFFDYLLINHLWWNTFRRDGCIAFRSVYKVMLMFFKPIFGMTIIMLQMGVYELDESTITDEEYFYLESVFKFSLYGFVPILLCYLFYGILKNISSHPGGHKRVYLGKIPVAGVVVDQPKPERKEFDLYQIYVGKTPGVHLPRIIEYIVVIVIVGLSAASLAFLLKCGFWFGNHRSEMVVAAMVFFVFLDQFLIEPSRLLFYYLFVKKDFRTRPLCRPVHVFDPNPWPRGDRWWKKEWYRPLNRFEREHLREKERRHLYRISTVYSTVVLLFCLLILFLILYKNHSRHAYIQSNLLSVIFTNSTYTHTTTLPQIHTVRAFWKYMYSTVIQNLHYHDPPRLTSLNDRLIGVAQLRQLRMADNGERKVLNYKDALARYDDLHEFDTRDYQPRWRYPYDSSYRDRYKIYDYKGAFRWRDDDYTNSDTIYGKLSTYPANGYISPLGRHRKNTLIVLNFLRANNWIDNRTRAVILEFSTINPYSQLYSLVTILFEFSLNNAIATTFYVKNFKLLFVGTRGTVWQYGLLGFCVLVPLVVFLHAIHVINLALVREKTQTTFWITLDVLTCILIFQYSILFYVHEEVKYHEIFNKISGLSSNTFIPSHAEVDTQTYLDTVMGLIFFLIITRLIQLLFLLQMTSVFREGLCYSFAALKCVLLFFAVTLVVFSVVFVKVNDFKYDSFVTLWGSLSAFIALILKYDYVADDPVSQSSGSLVYVAWVFYFFLFFMVLLMMHKTVAVYFLLRSRCEYQREEERDLLDEFISRRPDTRQRMFWKRLVIDKMNEIKLP